MISTNLERLQNSNERISLNIANAYVKAGEKGASLPVLQNSENLASTIEGIGQGSTEWKPELDWWDIDSILENDTEDYPAKMICLLSDSNTKTTIYGWNASKIVTSDGAEYVNVVADIQHTWDASKDKVCSLGYKTRYIIYYFENEEIIDGNKRFSTEILYCILKNMRINPKTEVWNSHFFRNCTILEYVKCVNTRFKTHPSFEGCSSLIKVEGLSYESYLAGAPIYSGCKCLRSYPTNKNVAFNNINNYFVNNSIKYIDFDFSKVKDFSWAFNGCSVNVIEILDLKEATNVSRAFMNTNSLISINQVLNISVSGLDFSGCTNLNHDTLIRIIDALCDYSDDTENVHNIIFGPTLLAKLSDEEKARIIRKAWTAS